MKVISTTLHYIDNKQFFLITTETGRWIWKKQKRYICWYTKEDEDRPVLTNQQYTCESGDHVFSYERATLRCAMELYLFDKKEGNDT